jgi:hypothetical protein
MVRNPVYFFKDRNSTGIDLVPVGSLMNIIDADGQGTPTFILLIDKTNITDQTTIGDFIDNGYQSWWLPSGGGGYIPGQQLIDGGRY